jgi:hypothetical protein
MKKPKSIKKVLRSGVFPPLFGANFGKPNAEWKRLASVDFDTLGRILACHRVVEHYLSKYLEIHCPSDLDWNTSHMTFSQKLSLATGKNSHLDNYGLPVAIRRLNNIRNRIGHDIEANITPEDVLPLKQCMESVSKDDKLPALSPPATIEMFTLVVCSYIAAFCTYKIK